MHAKKTLLLLVVVALLGFFVAREFGRGSAAVDLAPQPLLTTFDPARVARVRIENTPSDLHLSLERDAAGHWFITDPLAVKASDVYVRELFEMLVAFPGRRVTGVERSQLGLDPPEATIDLFEGADPATARRVRIAFGAFDLDRENVHVESEGRVLRVPRALRDMLDRSVTDYREKLVLPTIDAATVIAVRRRGSIELGLGSDLATTPADGTFGSGRDANVLDLALDVAVSEGEWLCEVPYRTRLDPAVMSFLVTSHTRLMARGFLDGLRADPTLNGFDDVHFTVELDTVDGRTTTIEFTTVPDTRAFELLGRTWLCRVDGDDRTHVRLESESVRFVLQRFEDLVQHTAVRVLRDEIVSVEARFDDAVTKITRVDGRFAVELDGSTRAADAGLVADWLTKVDRIEFAALIDESVWPNLVPQGRIVFELADRPSQALDLGPLVKVGGVEARAVRRSDEQVWGVAPVDLAELARTGPLALLGLRLFEHSELGILSVAVTDANGVRRRWMRDTQTGRFAPEVAPTLEDREFARLADRVIAPLGTGWSSAAPQAPALFEVEIELLGLEALPERYTLHEEAGRILARSGAYTLELDGRALVDGLTALLAR
jgi:hypothetical protein